MRALLPNAPLMNAEPLVPEPSTHDWTPPTVVARPRVREWMVRDELRKDDPARERSITRFALIACATCAVLVLAVSAYLETSLTIALLILASVLAGYYGVMCAVLSRGWFHPAVQWVNVGIEVSTPSAVFVLDAIHKGPEYALTAPPLVAWGALIMLSGLRARPPLAIAAGALAGVESVVIYVLLALPRLPEEALVTLTPAFIGLRAVFLVCTGVLTAMVAQHLVRRAETTVRAIRARDWMGKYILHDRLGAGGMAEVFRATYSPEGGFEKQVALKRILPAFAADPLFVDLFRREAQLGALLHHPNIVQTLDFGRHEGSYFLALEFVDGTSLKRVIQENPGTLSFKVVTLIATDLAAALEYVRVRPAPDGGSLGLVHRDLNPPNVLLTRAGEVKLTDFGIARARTNQIATDAGLTRGKAGYLAPEQVNGERVDHRADLFALGLTLFEAITGRAVYQGKTEAELFTATLVQEIPSLVSLRPETPPELERLVLALLQKAPDARPANAGEVLRMLAALPEEARPDGDTRAELSRLVIGTRRE